MTVTRPAGEVGPDVGMGKVDPELARQFQEEALRVVKAGEEQGVHLRVIGALAFWHHCPEFGYIQEKLNRVYTDIDFAGYGKQNDADPQALRLARLRRGPRDQRLPRRGRPPDLQQPHEPHPRRRVHGQARLLPPHPLEGPARGRLPRRSRWPSCCSRRCRSSRSTRRTSSTRSCCCSSTRSARDDEDHINSQHVAKLCAGEWGLWRTTTMNLEKVRDYLPHLDLDEDAQADRDDARRRAHERDGRLPQGHALEAARQGGRQGQVVQRDRLRGG